MVESAIGAHLLNASYTEGFNDHYWRDGKHEVDFVLERRGKVIGIEVKSGNSMPHSGMPEFQKQIRPDRILLVGKEGIPWQEFLRMSPVSLF